VTTGFGLPEGVDNGAVTAAHMLVVPPPVKTLKNFIQIIELGMAKNEK
jgi:hypothetical protein